MVIFGSNNSDPDPDKDETHQNIEGKDQNSWLRDLPCPKKVGVIGDNRC
jgi:hypothetical protein